MAYRRGNYDFVIDSSFQPFSMQEMLVPYLAYKEAFEESEKAYEELSNKADTFAYLSKELPEGSKARQIYEGYANELHKQATDLASNGLNMSNRGALTGLKRRYQGEIGRLDLANTALQQEKALRRQMSAKDPSMLYAIDNMNIDDFLDNNTPNLYSISGNELYTRGAAAGKAASSRIYSNPEVRKLDKYYNEYFSTVGYSPEKMQEFRENLAAIPELQQAAMDIARANKIGELGEGSANYQAALQQIVNGIADGAIYQRQSNMQRNLGAMTSAEQAADARAKANDARAERSLNMQAMLHGLKSDGKNGWVRDETFVSEKIVPTGNITSSGNPIYIDKTVNKPFAYGVKPGEENIKYYDNDKDGIYTDRNPHTKPETPKPPVSNEEILQKTGGLGIMVAKKGGKWQTATTDKQGEGAGTYIPIIDNIWGTRSKIIDWGGDWNLDTYKTRGGYRYVGNASELPMEAIQAINAEISGNGAISKTDLSYYDVYGIKSRGGDNKDSMDYVLWPKGIPFPYNTVSNEQKTSISSIGSTGNNIALSTDTIGSNVKPR